MDAAGEIEPGGAASYTESSASLCLLAPSFPPELRAPLRDQLGRLGPIEILVERRVGERRRANRRRLKTSGALRPADDGEAPRPERRRIRNANGRRIGERRTPLIEIAAPALSEEVRKHVAVLRFLRRREPSVRSREDIETNRLLVRLQAGDEAAFLTLYERYTGAILGYLRAVLGDDHEAEDGTQEVWARMIASLESFEIRGVPFRVWLFRVARNWALNQREKRTRALVEAPAAIVRRHDLDGQVELEAHIPEGDLFRLLRSIPVAQRQVLVLRHVAGMSVAEVAEVLGRSTNAVDHLHRRAVAFAAERIGSRTLTGAVEGDEPGQIAPTP